MCSQDETWKRAWCDQTRQAPAMIRSTKIPYTWTYINVSNSGQTNHQFRVPACWSSRFISQLLAINEFWIIYKNEKTTKNVLAKKDVFSLQVSE